MSSRASKYHGRSNLEQRRLFRQGARLTRLTGGGILNHTIVYIRSKCSTVGMVLAKISLKLAPQLRGTVRYRTLLIKVCAYSNDYLHVRSRLGKEIGTWSALFLRAFRPILIRQRVGGSMAQGNKVGELLTDGCAGGEANKGLNPEWNDHLSTQENGRDLLISTNVLPM